MLDDVAHHHPGFDIAIKGGGLDGGAVAAEEFFGEGAVQAAVHHGDVFLGHAGAGGVEDRLHVGADELPVAEMAVQDHDTPLPEIFREAFDALGVHLDFLEEALRVVLAAAQPEGLGEDLAKAVVEVLGELLDRSVFEIREAAGEVDGDDVDPVAGHDAAEPGEALSAEVMELQREVLDGP